MRGAKGRGTWAPDRLIKKGRDPQDSDKPHSALPTSLGTKEKVPAQPRTSTLLSSEVSFRRVRFSPFQIPALNTSCADNFELQLQQDMPGSLRCCNLFCPLCQQDPHCLSWTDILLILINGLSILSTSTDDELN